MEAIQPIQIGASLPSSVLYLKEGGQITETSLATWSAGRKVVLITVPGAFTPTCSVRHLPSYVERAPDFTARGVTAIGCLSVNDVHVMAAWGESLGAMGRVDMLADPLGETAAAMGIAFTAPMLGRGRASRLALVADDGVVSAVYLEKPGQFEVSAAAYVLERI